ALGNCENFSKTAWKIINDFSRDTHQIKNTKEIAIKIEDKIVENRAQVADEFNKYFSSVATVGSALTEPRFHGGDAVVSVASMAMAPVCEGEVARVIQGLNSKKSCDANGMSVWLLKHCFRHTNHFETAKCLDRVYVSDYR
ncbi:hypothetical protein J6590_072618, partial [Homalodisca vitripennis]